MGAELKVPDLQRAISRYSKTLKGEGRNILLATLPTVKDIFKKIFSRGQSGWAPLDSKYKARKKKQGLRPEILRATDRMYRALTKGSGDTEQKVTKRVLTYGLTDEFYNEYPKYSQGKGQVDRLIEAIHRDSILIKQVIGTHLIHAHERAQKVFKGMKPK